MVDLTFTCQKCNRIFCTETVDTQKLPKEIWFVSGPSICDNCKEIEKSEKRNKKLESLLKPTLKEKIKKWIKNCI